MDKKSMGTFLTDLRKERGLTQQEVADSLNVSNKTISKWERDEGYPEITILQEIAKFYGITTDELLEGSRKPEKENSSSEDLCNIQKENSMFERKKGVLLVSDCISVFSFVLYFLFSLFIDWSGSIFGLYGLVGSTIISLLTFTINLALLLKNKSEDKKTKKYMVNSFCFASFFFALNVISSVLFYFNVVLGNHIVFYLIAPVSILLGIAVTYIVFSKLSKKYDVCEISKEIKRLKKKMTVITTTICVLSLVIGIALGIFGALSMETYTTTKVFIGDDAGYLTSEDGISDYNKIKNHIVNKDDLYLLIEEEDKGILVSEFNYSFQNTEEGYKATYKGKFQMEYIPFETYEEKAEFIDKYVIEEDKSDFMDSMDENIKFNDVNYTITYKQVINYAELVAADCSFYICSVSMGLIPFIGLMTLIYRKKKTKV